MNRPIHTEPDRDGDFIAGLKVAFAAEALVVSALGFAIAYQLPHILAYMRSLVQ